MKKIFIPKIRVEKTTDLEQASQLLEAKTQLHKIDTLNWEAFSYKPLINFRVAHTGNEIWLKYYVREKYILARETRINGDVYKDSTVEFFISACGGKSYYNFEFSCIGTLHVAYGPGRGDRTFVSPELLKKISISSSLGNRPFEEKIGDFYWEMMICIPVECFAFDRLKTFDGLRATANFYKCGDETSEPHFVTWNSVKTESPDYHRPEFFGEAEFGS
ncbi:MAG: carbohydrate-binding family 9-like protein [Draconibacterium sp.]